MLTLADIRDRRDAILAIARQYGADQVRVFGSVVRGEAQAESDLDLLVRIEPGRSLLDQIALKHALEDLLNCRVDVVEDDAVYPGLREKILAEAVAL